MATQSGRTSVGFSGRLRRLGAVLTVTGFTAGGLVALDSVAPVRADSHLVPIADVTQLEAAIANAVDGQTLELAAGSYQVTKTLVIDDDISVVGDGTPDGTVVDGLGQRSGARVFEIASGATVELDGLTVTDGDSKSNGGGIYVAPGATLTLNDSTVRNNWATEGAGIYNDGTLVVDSSSVLNNIASKKGGGIRTPGSSTILNSTFVGNSGSQGGAISVSGSADVIHSTIVRNFSTSSSSAGVDRNGGTLRVFYSIIGDNTRSNGSAASDCSGTPDLIGLNLVTDSSGCNPVGPIDEVPAAALGVGALADNGGPTLTAALADPDPDTTAEAGESPAIDAIEFVDGVNLPCTSAATLQGYSIDPASVALDQRGIARGAANGCDLGAFELARFGVENFDLSVDTSAYRDRYGPGDYEDGVVEVGLTSVSIDAIADALNAPAPPSDGDGGSVESSGVRNVGVRNVGVRNVGVRNVGVRNVGVRNVGVRNVGVRNVGVRNVGVRNVGVRNVALQQLGIDTFLTSVPLSEIPLLASAAEPGVEPALIVPDGWGAYLAGTQYDGLPLQSLTIEQLDTDPPTPLTAGYRPFELITLEDIDLTNSVLGTIELSAATLAGIDLGALPLPSGANNWCDVFGELCEPVGGLTSEELAGLDMLSVQLAGGDVNLVDWASIELGAFVDALGAYPGDPESTGVRNVGVRNVALFSAGVRNVNLQNSGVRNVGVRNVGVRNVDGLLNIGLIVNCAPTPTPLYCQDVEENTYTLGELFELGPDVFLPGATVGDLLEVLELALAENPDLLGGLSLADFIALFAPTEQVPWEQIDLEGAQLQNLGSPLQDVFHYVTRFTVTGSSAESLAVTLDLPEGFILAAATPDEASTLTGGTLPNEGTVVTPTNSPSGGLLFGFPATALAPGDYELRVPVRAGLVTGVFEAMSSLDAVGATGNFAPTDEASVTVVPARDFDNSGGGTQGTARALSFGDLQLAHIAADDFVDLYEFSVGADEVGATARVFLSNVPDNADYDLSIYAPTVTPLRGGPDDSAGTRKTVGDIRYDLDPGDDVFPTDLADDIDLDVLDSLGVASSTHVLTDISSRRANEDEEVVIPAVVEGTYYVAVTSYLATFSNDPYGLRVRLDQGTELPECRPGDRIVNGVDLSVESAGGPAFEFPAGANTLYVTNLQWMNATFGAPQTGDIVDAALATGDFAGSTVIPAIVDVSADDPDSTLDDDVRTAYANWASEADRCDPEARNDVVRAIGALLDTMPSTVENIVILGDDGIVPMAAVPDLTGYSNEATYARDVLSGDFSNELAGALGEGYLLSDAPYGTAAGYEIRNAGHQVYIEEAAVGRLVETGQQIFQQLANFSTYEGRLDAGTNPATAAVTGYDFLTDGANAVADQFGAGVITSVGGVDLLGDEWTRGDFEALLALGPDVVSPNAHFDYEALLPAAADGTLYTDDQLVLTNNAALGGVDWSLWFTMGCHAGLSVSDVQLGFAGADWAQTLADGDNQWIAHTTYGYGDDEIVAYSERLAELFAGQVSDHLLGAPGAPATLGEAMVRAKQDYFATTFTLTPYDEKILQSWTYYGLPMYRIADGSATQEGAAQPLGFASTLETVAPAQATAPTGDVEVQLNRTTGNSNLNDPVVDADGTLAVTGNLNLVNTNEGNYYEVGRNVVTAQHRPVEPLVPIPLPDDFYAAGFLITGLTSTDVRPFDPLYLRPTVDLSGLERRVEPEDSSFPANLQLVTTDVTGSQRLLLAAGQFQDDTQRLYTRIAGELQPNNGSDGIGPRFVSVDVDGTDGSIEVTTDGPTERVVVLYQPRNTAQWELLELEQVGGVWTSSTPLPAGDTVGSVVEFLLQAVDGQGDVSITDNKVENFFNAGDPNGGPLTISTEPPANEAGFHNTDVAVTVNAAAVTDFDFVSLNGVEIPLDGVVVNPDGSAELVIDVTTEGNNVVFARDSSGSGQIFLVRVDKTEPVIEFGTGTQTQMPWSQGPVTVSFTASDLPGAGTELASGVASITIDGVETMGTTATKTIASVGETTVSAYATDRAGKSSAPLEVVVRIDQTAPTVDVATDPTNVVAGSSNPAWAQSTNVVLSTSSDGAPTEQIEYKLGAAGSEPADPWTVYSTPIPVNTEGQAVWAKATDEAGNVSAVVTRSLQIDTTAPTATLVLPSPLQIGDVAFPTTKECTDALSGIASCALSGAVNPDGSLDTSTPGTKTVTLTATDRAGNSNATTVPFTVVLRVCEVYDWTKAANPGSNFTIKVQICDPNGQPTADNGRLTLTAIEAYRLINGEIVERFPIEPNFSGNSNSGYEFRFSGKDKQYVYNLSTQETWGTGDFVLGFVVGPLPTQPREANVPTNYARFSIR